MLADEKDLDGYDSFLNRSPPPSLETSTSRQLQIGSERLMVVPPDETTAAYGSSTGIGERQLSTVGAQEKLEAIKSWGCSTYKVIRQALAEKMGKSARTVDSDVEKKIDSLRSLQHQYGQLLALSRTLVAQLRPVQQSQMKLADQFSTLADVEPHIRTDYLNNAQLLREFAANGEKLLAALKFFSSNINTLCNTTIEDTMLTVRHFEMARCDQLEYDAYRNDLEELKQMTVRPLDFASKLLEAEQQYAKHQAKYEQLRSDVEIKMQLLAENKVKVMKKQLLLFQNTVTAYFCGNREALEMGLRQFSVTTVRTGYPTSVPQPQHQQQ
ncbi:Arfaptin-1 [Trichinella pseudospiralis]|uniref:Arfaptin-1 n=1 Tax=Trichinella pseudospiralis TaxID=6337 RepID=A0A0V1J6C0_TRIPS|nr:Arfaptin-1 [Trichinella pseudospiralis]